MGPATTSLKKLNYEQRIKQHQWPETQEPMFTPVATECHAESSRDPTVPRHLTLDTSHSGPPHAATQPWWTPIHTCGPYHRRTGNSFSERHSFSPTTRSSVSAGAALTAASCPMASTPTASPLRLFSTCYQPSTIRNQQSPTATAHFH